MAPSMSTGYTDADSSRVIDYRSYTLHSPPKANLRQPNGEDPADGLARYVLKPVNVCLHIGKQGSDKTTGPDQQVPISGGGSTFSWSSPTVIALLVVGALSMMAFIWVEGWVAELPLFPGRL